MSNFRKVQEFNEIFGAKRNNVFKKELFDDKKLISLRMNLIREEMRELEEAVSNNDRVETVDALADILYVVYGMGDALGVDLDDAFKKVHESNMSKCCDNLELAKRTVKDYQEKYDKGVSPYDSPAYRFDEKRGLYIIYNESSGKVLKSLEYEAVNFNDFFDKEG